MSAATILVLVMYAVCFVVSFVIAYRWLVNDPDGTPEFHANTTGAFGFALLGPLFLIGVVIDHMIKKRRALA